MADTYWGSEPLAQDMFLVRGQDFTQIIDAPTNYTFPSGTKVYYQFVDADGTQIAQWDGQVAPSLAEFRVESNQSDLIPVGTKVYLYISDAGSPSLDLCWTVGKVKRK